MENFDLEKLKAGHKAQLKSGHKYKFGAYDGDVGSKGIIGWWEDDSGTWHSISHTKDGFYNKKDYPSDLDLVLWVPEYWVNVYENLLYTTSEKLNSFCGGDIFTDKNIAIARGKDIEKYSSLSLKYIETVRLPVTYKRNRLW
jgi:hypothetical protein